jgi:membrane protein required for colicin V production
MADLPITLFDVAVLAVLLVSTLLALSRGLVREVLALATWIGAAIATWYGFPLVRPLVKQAVGGDMLADLITGAGLFVVALVLLKLVARILAGGVDGAGLGFLDKMGGLAFGLARGIAVVCVGWLIMGAFVAADRQPDWVRHALLREPVEEGARWLQDLLPAGVAAEGREAVQKAGESARRLDTMRDVLVKPRETPADKPGYSEEQRREMDRLIKEGG